MTGNSQLTRCGRALWIRWSNATGLLSAPGDGARHVRYSGEAFRAQSAKTSYGAHRLRAIEERKPFLGLEIDRLQAGLLQCVRAGCRKSP